MSLIAPEVFFVPWTRSVFHRTHGVCFTAPEGFSVPWCSGRGRALVPFRGHEVSFIAHTECVSPRRRFSPFRGAVDAGGRLFRSAGTKCLSSRTRSVFHRAGGFLCSVVQWTRTRSVFHRAGNFLRSVVQWTREGASAIPWRTGLARTRCACRSVGGSGACVSGGAEGPIGFRCFQIADSTRKRCSENLRQGACGQLWLLRCTAAISRARSGSAQRSALQKI